MELYLHIWVLHWGLQTKVPGSNAFLQHFTNTLRTELESGQADGGGEQWTSVLTLTFGAWSWPAGTDTSVCLDVFKRGSSGRPRLSSEAASPDRLVLPEGSSLNWTVYGWSWLTTNSCCPGFNLATLSLPTTRESMDVGFKPSWGKRPKRGEYIVTGLWKCVQWTRIWITTGAFIQWRERQMVPKRLTVRK